MSHGLGIGLARLLVILGGVALVLLGLFLVALPGGAGTITGLFTVLGGMALIVGAVIERMRYRSESADRVGDPAGVAGGEPPGTALDARFQRTEEVFTDPTSGHVVRVWLDPRTGERRYLAEG
jgi:hypothetical protein